MKGLHASSKDWSKTLLSHDASIQEAIGNIDASGLQIALVIDSAGKFVGTLTDGDIRRGILKGFSLTSPVREIVQREPLTATPQTERKAVLELMTAKKIHQVPVIDATGRIADLYLWDELLEVRSRDNIVVVLAGGKGIRLRPYTEDCPKPMLPVRGKPILEHILDQARADGFTRFVFAINYLGDKVENHFADGKNWGVEISYIREHSPLGTAGALGLLKPTPSLPIIVTNGDLVTDLRYSELLDFHSANKAAATMAVRTHEWQNPFGVVQTDGMEIVGFEEKPVWRSQINAGIYALDPSALSVIGENEHCDMPSLFDRLRAANRRTIVYQMHAPWLDIGHPADLETARGKAD